MPKGPRVMDSEASPASYVNNGDAYLHVKSSHLYKGRSPGGILALSLHVLCPSHSAPASSLSIESSYTPASSPARTPAVTPHQALPFLPSALQEESASVSFKMRIGILFPPCLKPEGASCSLCKLFNWHMVFFCGGRYVHLIHVYNARLLAFPPP